MSLAIDIASHYNLQETHARPVGDDSWIDQLDVFKFDIWA
jgi:hypothetical protein